jgi:predicted phosphodiesterase
MVDIFRYDNSSDGFLFIGDPHIADRKPGRRKDKDFQATVLGKLEQSISIANEKNYIPVILGDLYDRPRIESESLKTRVSRILKKAIHRPVCLLGNHERKNAKLCDDDSIANLQVTEVLDLITESGPYGVFNFGSVKVGLGGTPHGAVIPNDISQEALFKECNVVIWLTHHDLEFEGAYPNSLPTHEIKGCKLVVNGHMHLKKKPKIEGMTTWLNAGNITRQAIDAIDHIPRVHGFNNKGQIEPITLKFEKNVFDLTGGLVKRIFDDEPNEKETLESAFVQLIQADQSSDFAKTDDGTILREAMEAKFEKDNTSNAVRVRVIELLNEALCQ